MPMLDPAMFDPASFASQPPGWLAQMLASQGGPSQGFPTPDAPPPDNGKIMPVPAMPPSVPPDAQASDADIPQTSLLGRLGGSVKDLLGGTQNWVGDHRATLAALGAGLMGSQNIGHGLQRAGQLIPGATQQDIAQQKQNQTVKWLVEQKHLSPQEAMAIVNNPEMMKQLLPRLMGARQLKWTTTKDWLGGEKGFFVDEASGRRYDEYGREVTPPSPTKGGGGGGGAQTSLADFDPSKVDESKHGWDYLAQFPPEIQAATRSFMGGGVMPTGNPRNNGIASYAKTVAQKIAMDLGQPDLADDTKFGGRREMVNGLNRSTPGSLGGQITFAGTSLKHLAEVAEAAGELKNSSGFGIAPLAKWINEVRGLSVDQAKHVDAVNGGLQHYGQEITKYYTGSPGGEAERMRFLNTMNTAKAPEQIAAAIRMERSLIPGRQTELESQIRQNLGEDGVRKYPVYRAGTKEHIERIDRALAKLDPNGPEAKMLGGQTNPMAPSPTAPKPGNYVWTPDRGLVPQ